jgi:hypothetical protein
MRSAICAGLVALISFSAIAGPKAELWERWTKHDDGNKTVIDHTAWNDFLGAYVKVGKSINRVAYRAVTAGEKNKLADYLKKMQGTEVSKLARTEQRAYWINLYNATTLKTILDHYPVESILKINISPGAFAKGPWGKKLLKIEGEDVSLDDIEHRILRPIWKDPRTHYAVNCASIGCPNLAERAWSADKLEQMLDAGARAYVNHPRGAKVENGRLTVSSIYIWFKPDFGGNDAGVIAHLKKYADPDLANLLKGVSRLSDDVYDWSLNDAK